jgi:hypothetical protein
LTEFPHGAPGRVNRGAARVIADVQLPLIEWQPQKVRLLGMTQRQTCKQNKTLQANAVQPAGKHAASIS